LCSTKDGVKEFGDKYREVFGSKIPEKIREFRTKKLNKWISGGRGIPYMPEEYMEKWDQLAITREAFTEMVRGKSAVVGVDMSKKIDLTACDFVFALDDDRVAITAHGFLPEEGITRHEKTDHIPYRIWAEQGWLTITEGDVTDSRRIEQHIQDFEMDGDINIYEVSYDPYQALSFSNSMQEKGYKLVEVRQTMQSLSEPTKLLREMVISGKLVHDGSPLLRSHVVNALQITDSKENIMITKKNASDTKRVDLLAAGITAMVRLPALREDGDSGDLSGLGF
jgi:phage terminase large subunit-like protein